MYFLMMPLSFSGGSQETNTTELLEAAAFTPAGGPGTVQEESSEESCTETQCGILSPQGTGRKNTHSLLKKAIQLLLYMQTRGISPLHCSV